MLDFMQKQTDANQRFIETQQEQNRDAIGRLAEEIKNIKVESVKELSQLVLRVDSVIDKATIFDRLNEMRRQKE
jgi:hypothetical protein